MVSRLELMVVIALGMILLFFAYYLYYAHRINQRVRDGQTEGRRLIDIPRVLMIAVILVLLLYSILESLLLREITENGTPRSHIGMIDTTDYTYLMWSGSDGSMMPATADYASIYSKDANPGYEKSVSGENGYTFTVFTRTGPADPYHPDFLCFIDYEGDTEGLIEYMSDGTVSSEEDVEAVFRSSAGGGEPGGNRLFIGNLDEGTDVMLHFGLLDEAGEKAYDDALNEFIEDRKADPEDVPIFKDYELSGAEVRIHVTEQEGVSETETLGN